MGSFLCGALAIGLAAVSVVRASEWLAVICLLAAGCLAIAAVSAAFAATAAIAFVGERELRRGLTT